MAFLSQIMDSFLQSRKKGVALVMASYLEDAEVHLPPVSIRLTASTLLTVDDICIAGKTILSVCREMFEGAQVIMKIDKYRVGLLVVDRGWIDFDLHIRFSALLQAGASGCEKGFVKYF